MYVEFYTLYIYFLSNISIVLRLVTLNLIAYCFGHILFIIISLMIIS
jgi:hypothetical protein